MNNDSRINYIRNHILGFTSLPVSQEFLDARPIIKTPATDEVEAVYYTTQDGLKIIDAMRLYAPHRVALMDESGDGAPVNLGTLDQFPDELPENATHAFYGLPDMSAFEIASVVRQADALGEPINLILIPWGATKDTYLQTGQLPE